MSTIIYVAIDKATGQVLRGASGQSAYASAANLRKSMSSNLKWKANRAGKEPKDLYSIYEIDVATVIPTQVIK